MITLIAYKLLEVSLLNEEELENNIKKTVLRMKRGKTMNQNWEM
jgi:hypothetical protein